MVSPSHRFHGTVIFWGDCQVGELKARLPVFLVSHPSELLTRTLICRHDSGNCATSPRNFPTIQAANHSTWVTTPDPASLPPSTTTHHSPNRHLLFSKNLLTFLVGFFPQTKSTRLPAVQGSRLNLQRGRMRTTALPAKMEAGSRGRRGW